MQTGIFKTKWGWIGVGATACGVARIILPRPSRDAVKQELRERNGARISPNGASAGPARKHVEGARRAVEAYLSGNRHAFALPLDLEGYPRFRKKVWQVLQTIPYGRVRSYGWIARKLGKQAAARAVGGACGANPMPLLIPCHRVVASNGSLGGFSGGLPVKKRLLRLEGISI